MGWLRVVGSLKSQVSFAEYSLFYRALLQRRPVILRSLLIVATPYLECTPLSMISIEVMERGLRKTNTSTTTKIVCRKNHNFNT